MLQQGLSAKIPANHPKVVRNPKTEVKLGISQIPELTGQKPHCEGSVLPFLLIQNDSVNPSSYVTQVTAR
jgi:hypothetical protein